MQVTQKALFDSRFYPCYYFVTKKTKKTKKAIQLGALK